MSLRSHLEQVMDYSPSEGGAFELWNLAAIKLLAVFRKDITTTKTLVRWARKISPHESASAPTIQSTTTEAFTIYVTQFRQTLSLR